MPEHSTYEAGVDYGGYGFDFDNFRTIGPDGNNIHTGINNPTATLTLGYNVPVGPGLMHITLHGEQSIAPMHMNLQNINDGSYIGNSIHKGVGGSISYELLAENQAGQRVGGEAGIHGGIMSYDDHYQPGINATQQFKTVGVFGQGNYEDKTVFSEVGLGHSITSLDQKVDPGTGNEIKGHMDASNTFIDGKVLLKSPSGNFAAGPRIHIENVHNLPQLTGTQNIEVTSTQYGGEAHLKLGDVNLKGYGLTTFDADPVTKINTGISVEYDGDIDVASLFHLKNPEIHLNTQFLKGKFPTETLTEKIMSIGFKTRF